MRVPFYDIQAQYRECSAEIDAVAHEVMAAGTYAMGPHHAAFESEMGSLHRVTNAIAVNSGTDALRIMLDAAEIGQGHEVITSAFTFVASAETIVQTGAAPVFVDIDEHFQLDDDAIEAAITERTRAIMPIHLFGQMADMEKICAIAKKHSLVVLEDAAQAVGCVRGGVPAGKFGVAGGLSFYVTKNLGAAGDAGMIVTNDDEFADRCRSMRVHGMGRQRYYYDHVGYTSRMDEVQAAVLRVKLKRLEAWNDARRQNAEHYRRSIDQPRVQLPSTSIGNVHTWHQFTLQSSSRDALMAHLRSEGIDSMIYYPVPLHYHVPYAGYGAGEGSLPATERACREVLSLPVHPHLSQEQADHVIEAVNSFRG